MMELRIGYLQGVQKMFISKKGEQLTNEHFLGHLVLSKMSLSTSMESISIFGI